MANTEPNPRALKGWLSKLESLNPSHIELGLERSRAVLGRMGLSFPGKIITVAGTNGKGTSIALLETLLRAEGFKVGAYTSPHLLHFRERIRLDAVSATDTQLVEAFEAVEVARENTHLTYFEFATLAAAYLFAQVSLDYYLMEVGLGGRLDAVNLFDPAVALVTNIGLDHTDWLGDTLELIAAEKAGVFRKDIPAVFASPKRPKAIDQIAEKVGAKALFAGRDFGVSDGGFWLREEQGKQRESSQLPISMSFSSEALAGVLAVLSAMGCSPKSENIQKLAAFELAGRFQQLTLGNLKLIADVAHNQDSAILLGERVEQLGISELTAVIGIMRDKSAEELITPMLDHVENWIVVEPNIDRAKNLKDVEQALLSAGVEPKNIHCCEEIDSIKTFLVGRDTAVVYGSFYTVAECFSALGVNLD